MGYNRKEIEKRLIIPKFLASILKLTLNI